MVSTVFSHCERVVNEPRNNNTLETKILEKIETAEPEPGPKTLSGTAEINRICTKLPGSTRISLKKIEGNLVFTPKIVAQLCENEMFDSPIDSLQKYNYEYNMNNKTQRSGPFYSEISFTEERTKVHFEASQSSGYYKVSCSVGNLKLTAVDKARENVKKLAAQAVLKTLLSADSKDYFIDKNVNERYQEI